MAKKQPPKKTTSQAKVSAGAKSKMKSIKPTNALMQIKHSATTKRPKADKLFKASKPVPASPPEPIEPEEPMPKTYLSDDELGEFRQLLRQKRAELVGDVKTLTSEALRDNQPGGAGNLSNMPIHMADVGSDNWEQDFTLDLLANEQQLLKEIDLALKKIDEKTYGMCEATRKPIPKKRLHAKPWARYCIEYARKKEQGLVQ